MSDQNAPDTLSVKQLAAITALIGQPTLAQAAQSCGVNEKTLYRWMQQSAFAEALAAARRQALSGAIDALQSASGRFVAVLLAIAEDTSKPAAARVTAARSGIEYALRGKELELEERIVALERIHEQQKGGRS